MEKENIVLLDYFNRFKELDNFDAMKEKLTKLSAIRYHHDITIGKTVIPFIGPDKNLLGFSKEIEKLWGHEAGKELSYVLKYYEGGSIETIEEALIVVSIKQHQTNQEIYQYIKDRINDNKPLEEDKLSLLLEEEDIMSSNLYFFLISL